MAIAAGVVNFTGPMGDVSAYRMKGTDKIIMRRKGGVSKQRIKTHPNFDLTRRNNEEWKACIGASKNIRNAMNVVTRLADYNFSGHLHALCKNIQLDDTANEKGKRSVSLSTSAYKLEGFGLNKYNSFDSIVRHPLQYSINRVSGTATVNIPELISNINLHNPKKQPLYRFVMVLGTAADMLYCEIGKKYRPSIAEIPFAISHYTPWHSWKENNAATTIVLSLPDWQDAAGVSLILAAGIEFGVPLSNAVVQSVKYAGAGKVLRVV